MKQRTLITFVDWRRHKNNNGHWWVYMKNNKRYLLLVSGRTKKQRSLRMMSGQLKENVCPEYKSVACIYKNGWREPGGNTHYTVCINKVALCYSLEVQDRGVWL